MRRRLQPLARLLLALAFVDLGSAAAASQAGTAAIALSMRELVAHGTAITVRVQPSDACAEPTAEALLERRVRGDEDGQEDVASFLRRLPPRPSPLRATSSGTILNDAGEILSAVLDGECDRFVVTFSDGTRADARRVAADGDGGLALLRSSRPGPAVPRFAPAGSLHPGDTVLAFGSVGETLLHVGRGIVGSVTQTLPEFPGSYRGMYIQTDADIRRGSAGGPLLDVQGRVVGLHLAIYSSSGAFEGVSFALPSAFVLRAAADLRQHGRVLRGALGASFVDAFDGSGAPSVTVRELTPGLPAAAVLRVGDRVLAVDGALVRSSADIAAQVQSHRPGETVALRLQRGRAGAADGTQELTIVLADSRALDPAGVQAMDQQPLDHQPEDSDARGDAAQPSEAAEQGE